MTNNKVFGTIIGVAVVLGLVWAGFSSWQSHRPDTSGLRQAVFLADGQVFFGYASSLGNQVVKLQDVYYLKAQATLQPADKNAPAPATSAVDLIKLGEELHGPTDVMLINRDRINFIEDMKEDSQINKAIDDYLQKKVQGS